MWSSRTPSRCHTVHCVSSSYAGFGSSPNRGAAALWIDVALSVWKHYLSRSYGPPWFIVSLKALPELIILPTLFYFPCSSKLSSFNLLVRPVKNAMSSSHLLSWSWVYSAYLLSWRKSFISGQSSWNLSRNFPNSASHIGVARSE